MKINKFGEMILDESDIIKGLYSGKIDELSRIFIDDLELIDKFNTARKFNADHFPDLRYYEEPTDTVEIFDSKNQNQWFMPQDYKDMDISAHLLNLCVSKEETQRVDAELTMFYQYDMLNVLKYLKYLVDTMRSRNIIWGVGRGSSVASYCLYLLGVHKINSLKYNLDIHEFLK